MNSQTQNKIAAGILIAFVAYFAFCCVMYSIKVDKQQMSQE